MKILLIEDDKKTSAFIIKGLNQAGYTVDHSVDGVDGLFKATEQEFDLAIIDIMIPRLDGLTVVDRIRQKEISVPIIILSAKNSVEDKVKGLQKGCDDYIAKPFSFSELLARIQALLRRATSTTESTTLTIADLKLDVINRRVTRGGIKIEIQPLEYMLLEYLIRNKERVISKTMIMEHVWEYNFDPNTNVVEARICRLRDKIDRPFAIKLLHTVRGFGYVLEEKQ